MRGDKLLLISFILALSISFASATYPPDQYTAAYWNFEECDGEIANDITGNGNTGTLNNVEWTADGYSGCATVFNGIDGKISAVKAPSLDITEQVTLEAWIMRHSQQDGTIFSRNGPFYIAVRSNKLQGGIHTNGGAEGWTTVDGTTDLQLEQWYHVAMTYTGSRIRVFVNGIEEGSALKSGIMVVRSQAPYIGWGEPGQNQYFHGIIDEVRVSNIARTSFDVSTTTTTTTSTTTTIDFSAQLTELETRIADLEASQLEQDTKLSFLETTLTTLNALMNQLQDTVSDLFINLFGLPKGLRQQMVCEAMIATNQTSATGFGLTCSINEKGTCSCI